MVLVKLRDTNMPIAKKTAKTMYLTFFIWGKASLISKFYSKDNAARSRSLHVNILRLKKLTGPVNKKMQNLIMGRSCLKVKW